MKKLQGAILSLLFLGALLAGGLWLLLSPARAYSEAERRPLAEAPALTEKALRNGRFFTQLDSWTTDHFPARERFRQIKALWQLRVLRENENDGLVEQDGSLIKLEKQVNEASLAYAGERFGALYDSCLVGTACRLYCAVIPDKSFFLEQEGYPVMDLGRMEDLLSAALPGAEAVSLTDVLSLEDYYRTDSHWRQERILPAAERLLSAMGRDVALDLGALDRHESGPFLGVYAGQSALDPDPETIVYLTGGPIAACTAMDLETRRPLPLYDPEGCDSRDLYTLFLGGARGVLRLTNPAAPEGRDLVVFRDSFGSSIGPLLSAGYRSVTLIDLRYINPSVLPRFVRFTDQDVLFLCSATLLNNSQGLR